VEYRIKQKSLLNLIGIGSIILIFLFNVQEFHGLGHKMWYNRLTQSYTIAGFSRAINEQRLVIGSNDHRPLILQESMMLQVIGDALPWPHSDKRERATTSETTSGGTEATRWVAVAVNLNPAEAAVIKARLESENIPTLVQQEAMGSVLGLTVGPMGSAKVLVPEPLVERALAILAETFEQDGDEFWEDDEFELEIE
jgi:hypothetical protein